MGNPARVVSTFDEYLEKRKLKSQTLDVYVLWRNFENEKHKDEK